MKPPYYTIERSPHHVVASPWHVVLYDGRGVRIMGTYAMTRLGARLWGWWQVRRYAAWQRRRRYA